MVTDRVLLMCALILSLGALTAAAGPQIDPQTYRPSKYPVLHVAPSPGQIDIDGDLADPGWRGAFPATDFSEHEPGEEVMPPVKTRAFVTYDADNLYLAAVCYAEPGTVRASICEREQIFNDDNIGFFFDTYGDATRAYIINLNPHGIPYDALWSPETGEDQNFDLVFESAGRITDSGYQVEMAIPFRSLRFPNRPVQEWRFDFWRHHQREVHYSMSWAQYDLDLSCWPCKWGTVTGIRDISPGHGMELIGSLIASQSGSVEDADFPRASFRNGDLKSEASIGGRYALTSDITVDGTINPDFSQIEADASQVDVNTTFALSYPEKRPFFQEGMDAFRTSFAAVYTRSINDPSFAVKGTAKLGRTSVVALFALDENSLAILPFEEQSEFVALGKSYTNMVALRRSFGGDDHLRLLATDRRYDAGGSGSLASLDGAWRVTKSLKVRAQLVATHTEEPNDSTLTADLDVGTFDDGAHTATFDGETFSGTGALVGANWESRKIFAAVSAYQRTPTYRADNGFQPQNSDRRLIGQATYYVRPQGGIVKQINPGIDFGQVWNFDGVRKDEWLELQMGTSFNFAQAAFYQEFILSRERFGGEDFKDIRVYAMEINAHPYEQIGFGTSVVYGRMIARNALAMGNARTVGGWFELRPTSRLLAEFSLIHDRSRDVDTDVAYFDGYITRVKLNYQFTRRFSTRVVGEYNDFDKQWNLDPLITYRLNPFSTFYAGAAYDYLRFEGAGASGTESLSSLNRRQFFVKLQYLFQT